MLDRPSTAKASEAALTGVPLLLLPGTLCDERVFEPVVGGLGRQVRVAEMAGARSAPDLARRILSTAPPRFALCGFSLGAIVALEVIAQAPDRVDRLALLGGNARPIAPANADARRKALALAETEGNTSFVAGVWDASVPAHRRDDGALRTLLDTMAADAELDTFRDQVDVSIDRLDSRPRLASIDVPTLILCGEEDAVAPPELSREIAAAIPQARLRIIPRAGHYLTFDQPEIVAAELAQWLAAPAAANSRIPRGHP